MEKGIRDHGLGSGVLSGPWGATASSVPFSRQSWEAGVCIDMTTRCRDTSESASVRARSLTLLLSSPLAAVLDRCVVGGS